MIELAIKKLVSGEQLSLEDVVHCAREMMSGEATPVQMAAFLTGLRLRGESVDDLTAFASVMREHAHPFKRSGGIVLDTCGTGGDASGTFNISTAAAFVAAGAGVRVAKHGNRSMSSKCGSADVLAELGVRIEAPVEVMEQAFEECGICFLFAQRYHQSMRHVGPVRRELGFRTVFNLLGPLSNPARATHQLIGVFSTDHVAVLAQVLSRLGIERAMVVHGKDGLDEITTTTLTHVAELHNGEIREHSIDPAEFDIPRATHQELLGGDARQNAEIISRILAGEKGPATDIVVLNAGAAIYVAGRSDTMQQAVKLADESIRTGAARDMKAAQEN